MRCDSHVCLCCAGAGALSGGGGYGRLGGIQQYSQTLRELVMLPLQLPQLFARYVHVKLPLAGLLNPAQTSLGFRVGALDTLILTKQRVHQVLGRGCYRQ